ncbi:MAG: PAS domain S-box protein [Bacteroidetes bacterium]|nr:PAS domain S-box protein [Bacteroidota bacterium]
MRNDRLKLLILEKNYKEIEKIKSLLKKTDFNFQTKVAKDDKLYNQLILHFSPDVIIANYYTNDLTAFDALTIAKKKEPTIIFIIFTESVDELTAVKCLKNGAWDYILKNRNDKLIPSIKAAFKFRNYELLNKYSSETIRKSEERYKSFIEQSSEGIFRIELNKPLDVTLPEIKQIKLLLKNSFIAECNNTMAKMHGFSKASELVGLNLNVLMPIIGEKEIMHYKQFVKNNYKINNVENQETDRKGNSKFFVNNLTGIVENGNLLRIWGIQKDITQVKKVEEAFRKSEERFKLLFNNLLLGLYQMTVEGRLTLANPALVQMLGYDSLNELIQSKKIVRKYLSKKDKVLFFKQFEEKDFIVGYETIWVKKDGNFITVRESTKAVRDENSKIISFEGIVEDISERKKFETALIESEERFSLIADTAPIMIWIGGADKFFFYFNKSWLDFTGKSLIEELGNRWMENIHPDDIDEFLMKYSSSFDLKKEFEIVFRLKRYDNEFRWILTRGIPRFLSEQLFAGFIGTAIDITDRKIAEDALKASEEKYRSVVQNVREVIFKTDDAGVFTLLNPYWKEITGYEIDESLYKSIFEFIHPDDKRKATDEFISIIYKKKEFCRFEVRTKTKYNSYRWMGINARIIIDDDLNILGTYGTFGDVHDRRLAEEELIKAKDKAEASDRLKSIFLAQISHEIRTPLNIILGYNSLIKEKLNKEFSKDLESEFTIINNSGKRLLRTIDLILNMSLVQTGGYELVKEEINLEKLLINLTNEFKPVIENKKIKLLFNNENENNFIFGDIYTLTQAFQNLIDNAIKFTIEGQVEISLCEKDDYILADIADTGIGISDDYLPRLFEPFSQEEIGYSRRFEGNGLGLALTKKYIELNNAEIFVRSKKGQGTTFTVKINKIN